jgi:hypothetical protein
MDQRFFRMACAIIDAPITMTPLTASMFHLFRRFASVFVLALLVCQLPVPALQLAHPVAPTPTSSTPATLQPQPLSPTPVPDTAITLTLWLPTRFCLPKTTPLIRSCNINWTIRSHHRWDAESDQH